MGFLSWLQEHTTGITLAEYGELSRSATGLKVSVALRKHRDQGHYLAFKWQGAGQLWQHEIEATPEVLDRLEGILGDVGKKIGGRPT
jgi:hypothetical protein